MEIRELFEDDVERDIPPVVYFQEQSPDKLKDEVSEYIITGGYPKGHAHHRPDGIHESYVRILNKITEELKKTGGPDLPNVWVSGFYGSGKSSFAKILGMALDGTALPDGSSVAEAWLKRNSSQNRQEMVDAWNGLKAKVDSIAVVFDVGGAAKDNEHVHAAILRHVQKRLGYCCTSANVADYELKLEREGEWDRFIQVSNETLDEPWQKKVEDEDMFADEDFSLVMSKMFPEHFPEPMTWFQSRAGTHQRNEAPNDAAKAIGDMLKYRKPGATLFIVVDEVSQYVLSTQGRSDRLRAFASALGSVLKGQAWMIAIGQQKIDQEADDSFLVWAKDRFPVKLRVHLSPTNIQEVVHRRLLKKSTEGEDRLKKEFEQYRADLQLYAYGCEEVTSAEFVEFYPMLPKQIDLMLRITSALRTRSGRAQGDDQAIRGLLQMLGELFRAQKLAGEPVGTLVTLDKIYDVQKSALDSDIDQSMSRIMQQCSGDAPMVIRVAKAVAMLELIQDTEPTTAKLVAQCLFFRMDRGNQEEAIEKTLEDLKHRGLLGYSEKQGYKIQSSAGEEWDRELREVPIAKETISELIKEALGDLMAEPERPKLDSRAFPWASVFTDGRKMDNAKIMEPRDPAVVRIDFRYLRKELRNEDEWTKKSGESFFKNRIVWVCGETDTMDEAVRQYAKSAAMVEKYQRRKDSLTKPKQLLLQEEEHRREARREALVKAVSEAWLSGSFYFRDKAMPARSEGNAFNTAVSGVARKCLHDIYDKFDKTQVSPSEMMLLLEQSLTGPPAKFMGDDLGILEKDGDRYTSTCSGQTPQRILAHIEEEQGLSGGSLLSHFCGPPFAYTSEVVKACVAGLLRAEKVMLQTDSGKAINVVRDSGVREVFEKDGKFNKANIFPAGETEITPQLRARIRKLFKDYFNRTLDNDSMVIADAVSQTFPEKAKDLRETIEQFDRLNVTQELPSELTKLQKALEDCLSRVRETNPTLKKVEHNLDALRDGFQILNQWHTELTDETVASVRDAVVVRDNHLEQLNEVDSLPAEQNENADLLTNHLKGNRPWQEISVLNDALEHIRSAYKDERSRLLAEQGDAIDTAKNEIKSRHGFSTLPASKSDKVLHIVESAEHSTSDDAIAPSLLNLKSQFQVRMREAKAKANELLDQLLSQGDNPMIVTVDLSLDNRELKSEEDVEALLDEIRQRLLGQLKIGQRVRLI